MVILGIVAIYFIFYNKESMTNVSPEQSDCR
jgi:hypothetical protein